MVATITVGTAVSVIAFHQLDAPWAWSIPMITGDIMGLVAILVMSPKMVRYINRTSRPSEDENEK